MLRSHKTRCTLLLTLLILIAGRIAGIACPFCLAPPETWAEILSGADVIVIGEMVELRTFDAEHRAETEFLIRRVRYPMREQQLVSRFRPTEEPSPRAQASDRQINSVAPSPFTPGQRLVLQEYVTGKPGDLFLLAGRRREPISATDNETFELTSQSERIPVRQAGLTSETPLSGESLSQTAALSSTASSAAPQKRLPGHRAALVPGLVQWDSAAALSADAVTYILNAPDNAVPSALRLPYYVAFLESADPEIAADAWGEFARSQYEDVKSVRHLLQPARLRQWIADPRMSPERLGLYGMLLGLCGDAQDAVFLREQIGVPAQDQPFRYGVEGLMGGLMLLEGDQGLQFLEDTRLTAAGCASDELFATVQAIQFMWSYEPERIAQSRLRTSLHVLLDNPQLCELVITNLARWEDWPTAVRLIELFDRLPGDDPGSRRAILKFMLALQKASLRSQVASDLQQLAGDFLQRVDAEFPELAKAVQRDFGMQ